MRDLLIFSFSQRAQGPRPQIIGFDFFCRKKIKWLITWLRPSDMLNSSFPFCRQCRMKYNKLYNFRRSTVVSQYKAINIRKSLTDQGKNLMMINYYSDFILRIEGVVLFSLYFSNVHHSKSKVVCLTFCIFMFNILLNIN